jgi:hypothetical protein
MEGIMNLPANVGGATSQDGLDSFAPLIAAQQAARDMGYPRFTRELLSAGSEIDQAEVQEFLQTIRDAGLTSDDVAMMRRVVEAVFGDPNNYPESVIGCSPKVSLKIYCRRCLTWSSL